MTNFRNRLLLLLSLVICSSAFAQTNNSTQDYIRLYSDLAVKEMKRAGIPASITLAQGILESGNGNSSLARKSNNHFGIKCHSDWDGKRVYYDDDAKGECFRKYSRVYDSYIDHSDFLTGKSRYASLFELKITDYKGWAKGLKKAGYATDPSYAHRLIKIIEDYDLSRFDDPKYKAEPSSNTSDGSNSAGSSWSSNSNTIDAFGGHDINFNNRVKYVRIKSGDSFLSIAEEFGLRDWELIRYNDLPENANISDYSYLYLQPKKSKAYKDHTTHKVKSGETLHYISQKYGVKLKKLKKYNDISNGSKVLPTGSVVYLRRHK